MDLMNLMDFVFDNILLVIIVFLGLVFFIPVVWLKRINKKSKKLEDDLEDYYKK